MRKTPLKRLTSLPRTAPLPRSGIKGRRAPLKASGETKRKKRARYAAYLKSPEWKAKRAECFKRAGQQCEVYWEIHIVSARPNLEGRGRRCHLRPDNAHHKTYARLYNELPEDLAACCRMCHRAIEQTYYPHRHGDGRPEPVGNIVNRALARLVDDIGDAE